MAASAMKLQDTLADARRLCPEADVALLVDAQGMLVESYVAEKTGIDAEEVAAEALAATSSMMRLVAASRMGGLNEWLLSGEGGVIVARRIPSCDLLLIVRADSAAWMGRLRFAARVTAGRISSHLV